MGGNRTRDESERDGKKHKKSGCSSAMPSMQYKETHLKVTMTHLLLFWLGGVTARKLPFEEEVVGYTHLCIPAACNGASEFTKKPLVSRSPTADYFNLKVIMKLRSKYAHFMRLLVPVTSHRASVYMHAL